MLRRSFLLLSFILIVAASTGCGKPRLGRYDIRVQLDEMLQAEGHVYTVDLIGTNDPQRWEAVDVNRYFPDSEERLYAEKETLTLSGEEPRELPKGHKIWSTWRNNGVRDMVVLVDLPFRDDGALQGLETRRKIFSLMTDTWRNKQTIRLEIRPNGIFLQSPTKE